MRKRLFSADSGPGAGDPHDLVHLWDPSAQYCDNDSPTVLETEDMSDEVVKNMRLPALPHGAAYIEDKFVEPSALPTPASSSTVSPRRFSPFSLKPLTCGARRKQQQDALLPALSVSCQVKSICSSSNLKVVIGSTGCGKSTQIPQLIAQYEEHMPRIWVSASRDSGCISLQERLLSLSEDTAHIKCVSSYRGPCSHELSSRGWEVVAVHTVDTLLLRFDTLRQECLMRKEQEQPSPHLIIDEAADCKQGLVLASALALHEQGLLRIWVMSSAMPPQLLWHLQNQPHDLVDMGGLPYGLRMVTVACIQGA